MLPVSSPDSSQSPDSASEKGRDDHPLDELNQVEPDSQWKKSSDGDAQAKTWMALVGLGMELAGSTLLLAGAGHLIDRYRGTSDGFGIAIGAFLGFGLGMFRFIQKALAQIEKP